MMWGTNAERLQQKGREEIQLKKSDSVLKRVSDNILSPMEAWKIKMAGSQARHVQPAAHHAILCSTLGFLRWLWDLCITSVNHHGPNRDTAPYILSDVREDGTALQCNLMGRSNMAPNEGAALPCTFYKQYWTGHACGRSSQRFSSQAIFHSLSSNLLKLSSIWENWHTMNNHENLKAIWIILFKQ